MLWMVMLQDCWARAASLVPCLTCSLTGGGFYQVDWCWTILYHSGVPPCVSSPPSPPSTPPSCSSSRWARLAIGSKLCVISLSLRDLLNLAISALHDHWHCLPLAPPPHLSAAGEEKHPHGPAWKVKCSSKPPEKVVPAILYPILHTQGATSHKFVDPTGNYWMHLYYTDRQTFWQHSFNQCFQ